jgi:hypothetical protein
MRVFSIDFSGTSFRVRKAVATLRRNLAGTWRAVGHTFVPNFVTIRRAVRPIRPCEGAKKIVPAIVGRPAIDENLRHVERKISELEERDS